MSFVMAVFVTDSKGRLNGLASALRDMEKISFRFGRIRLMREPLAVTEAADLPEIDLAVRSGSAATGALPHAVDIAAARVLCPDRGFALKGFLHAAVMLLNPQITDGVAGRLHGCQQLQTVVLRACRHWG